MADDAVIELGTVFESTTRKLTLTLQDEDGVAIPGSSLDACTLTLYDEVTGAIINSRNAVDVKSSVDGAGLLTFLFTPEDLAAVGSTSRERRIVHVEWTYQTTRKGRFYGRIQVQNETKP